MNREIRHRGRRSDSILKGRLCGLLFFYPFAFALSLDCDRKFLVTTHNRCYVQSHPTEKPAEAGFFAPSGNQRAGDWSTEVHPCGFRPGHLLEDRAMPPPYLDFLDPECLPPGLTDQAYATWIQSLRDLYNSCTLVHLEQSYQFCRGFVQALQDMQAVEPGVYLRLEARLSEAWLERAALFQGRG